MLTENEFNIIYEFLDRVTVKGHNERIAMNSVIIKMQENTIVDKDRTVPVSSNIDESDID
jgi:hypothetical protein